MKRMYYANFQIQSNYFTVVGNEEGLRYLHLNSGSRKLHIQETWELNHSFFHAVEKQLQEYFEGVRTSFDLKLNLEGTEFQRKVWKALSQIPYGETASYKDIADKIDNPKAVRAVGMANNRNPIPLIIPCHRVVGSNGSLTGYAFGLPLKKYLLEHELINRCFNELKIVYGSLQWWPADTAFEMMVGAILTQNTAWTNVMKALDNLGENISPKYMEELELDVLSEKIRPSGYHNQKAKKLKELCKWFKTYDYNIENVRSADPEKIRKELLNVYGVGPETADSIMVYALHHPFFVIDTYTRRLFFRLGIDVPEDYEQLRFIIESHIPPLVEVYNQYHALIVEHAKQFCLKKPLCNNCPLTNWCLQRI